MDPAAGADPTDITDGGRLARALRHAAVWATLAPSFYNTQPWAIELDHGLLRLRFDFSRHLPEHDPDGRQLTISCGCALFNARTALADDGYLAEVVRLPVDPPLTTAAIVGPSTRAVHPTERPDDLAGLAGAVVERRMNRMPFTAGAPTEPFIARLQDAAAREATVLMRLYTAPQKLAVRALHRAAVRLTAQNPTCRAEHRAWAGAAGYAQPPGSTATCDGSPAITEQDDPAVLLLTAPADEPSAWLRAGEALERVLLQVTSDGFVASLVSQVTQVSATRNQLRCALGLASYPMVLLQVGTAPNSPRTRRRRLVEAINDNLDDHR